MSSTQSLFFYPLSLKYSDSNTVVVRYINCNYEFVARSFYNRPGFYAAIRLDFTTHFVELVQKISRDVRVSFKNVDVEVTHKIFLQAIIDFVHKLDTDGKFTLVKLNFSSNIEARSIYNFLFENSESHKWFVVLPEFSPEMNIRCEHIFEKNDNSWTLFKWSFLNTNFIEDVVLATNDDIRSNMLVDPIEFSPKISIDIETISKDLESFPVGNGSDEMISSISVVSQFFERTELKICRFMYILRPDWISTKTLEDFSSKFPNCSFLFFDTEKELLQRICKDLRENPYIFNTFPFAILTGFNIDKFDIPYIVKRLWFHDLISEMKLFKSSYSGWKIDMMTETEVFDEEVNLKYIIFDLLKYIEEYCSFLPNKKLNTVGKYFCGISKGDLSPVLIRHIYFNEFARKKKFLNPKDEFYTVETPNGSLKIPTLGKIVTYNLQDSQLVLDVLNTLNLNGIIKEIGSHTMLDGFKALTRGKITLSSRVIISSYLKKKNFVGNLKKDVFLTIPDVYDEESFFQVSNVYSQRELLRLGESNFGGGANDAKKGIYGKCASGDFKSFYPSIIRAYNLDLHNTCVISKSMLDKFFQEKVLSNLRNLNLINYQIQQNIIDAEVDEYCMIRSRYESGDKFIYIDNTKKSNLAEMFSQILSERDYWKKIMKESQKNSQKYKEAESKQAAYKLLANSIYGTLGTPEEYNKINGISVAAATTNISRAIIKRAIECIPKENNVVYVDTDGIIYTVGENDDNEEICANVTSSMLKTELIFEPEEYYASLIVLGRKTYVKIFNHSDEITVESKGFEKNAPLLIKEIFRRICIGMYHNLKHHLKKLGQRGARFKFNQNDLANAIFKFLLKQEYEGFMKSLRLTERHVGGELTNFIARCLDRGMVKGSTHDYIHLIDKKNKMKQLMLSYDINENTMKNFYPDLGLFLKNHFSYMIHCLNPNAEVSNIETHFGNFENQDSPFDGWFEEEISQCRIRGLDIEII